MIANIRFAAGVATLAAAVTVTACSSSGAQQHADNATAPASAGSGQVAAAPAANTVAVTAYDRPTMRYVVEGHPQAGLVTINYKNAGDDAHEMTLARLKPGVTLAQIRAALHKPNPDKAASGLLIDPHGEITGPQILGPGRSETATVPLVAGHYVVVCFLPGKNGKPHAVMGMVNELTVAGGTSGAQPPQTDGTVRLTDSGITVPANLRSGGTFAVTNAGTKPHDFGLAKLTGSLPAYFQCVGGSFGRGTPIDRCPGTLAGGITSLAPGHTAYLTLAAFPAGSYGYVSTEGDGADFQAGLNGTFTVK